MPTKKTLRQKLHAIMGELEYIKKDGTVAFGNTKFTYLSERAVKEAMHPLFVKHGVLLMIDGILDSCRYWEKGNSSPITFAAYKLRFLDVDSEAEESMVVFGQGQDPADKGIYKAITGALRHGLASTFLVPTGDDPEKDTEKHAQKPQKKAPRAPEPTNDDKAIPMATKAQKKNLWEAAEESGVSLEELTSLAAKLKCSLKTLPAAAVPKLLKAIREAEKDEGDL